MCILMGQMTILIYQHIITDNNNTIFNAMISKASEDKRKNIPEKHAENTFLSLLPDTTFCHFMMQTQKFSYM